MRMLEIARRLEELAAEQREADEAFDSDRLEQICDEAVFLQDYAMNLPPTNLGEAVLQIGIARQALDDARAFDTEGMAGTLEQIDEALALLSQMLLGRRTDGN